MVIANEGSKMPLKTFAVSIDSVERLTGLDFFPWMSETLEAKTEARLCLDCWSWGKGHYGKVKKYQQRHHTNNEILPQVSDLDQFRCHGITKKGNRCKRKVRVAGANCFQHGG
jgi:endonuclease G